MPTVMPKKVCLELESCSGEYNYVQEYTRTYNIFNYDTADEAFTALIGDSKCPADLYGRTRQSVSVQSVLGFPKDYTASASWTVYEPDSLTKEIFQGSIGTRSVNVRTTHNTVIQGQTAGDTYDAIADTGLLNLSISGDQGGTMSVAGASIPVPLTSFQITKYYNPGTWGTQALEIISNYVGKPNSLLWRGWGPKEVMLVGADGEQAVSSAFDTITYAYEVQRTEGAEGDPLDNVEIKTLWGDGTIVLDVVRGFEYVHVAYMPITAVGTEFSVPSPHTVWVEDLTETVNLTAMEASIAAMNP